MHIFHPLYNVIPAIHVSWLICAKGGAKDESFCLFGQWRIISLLDDSRTVLGRVQLSCAAHPRRDSIKLIRSKSEL
jgi:hypothetical protein